MASRPEIADIASTAPRKKPVTINSRDYKVTMFGILNAQGDFWTPVAFESEAAARDHIRTFWRNLPEQRDQCLRTHKVVPVYVRLTLAEKPHGN